MPRCRAKMVALLAILLACLAAAPASAQAVLGQSQCRGSYQDIEMAGLVVADLWQAVGPTGGSTLDAYGLLYEHLMRGELDQIPGTVRLFGDMRDSAGNLVNFEVFLQGVGEGTGSVWINGARHRETYIHLVLGKLGFDIYTETYVQDGEVAHFTCEIVE